MIVYLFYWSWYLSAVVISYTVNRRPGDHFEVLWLSTNQAVLTNLLLKSLGIGGLFDWVRLVLERQVFWIPFFAAYVTAG